MLISVQNGAPAPREGSPSDIWWDAAFGGNGFNETVLGLASRSNSIYAVGWFTRAGTNKALRVARWNGQTWRSLGGGVGSEGNYVGAIALSSNTDVYVGGAFAMARNSNGAAVSATNIARWKGSEWSDLDGGMNDIVNALVISGTNLYAGGRFTRAGSADARGIAHWDGQAWHSLGPGIAGEVSALVVDGGYLYAGGSFSYAGATVVNNVARWDGTNWTALKAGLIGRVNALAHDGTNLYAGGQFNDNPYVNLARWDGAAWSALTTNVGISYVTALHWGGGLFVGWAGDGFMKDVSTLGIARVSECGWSPLGSGVDGSVNAILEQAGKLYVGGYFYTAGGRRVSHVARWNAANRAAVVCPDIAVVEGDSGTNLVRLPVAICPPPQRTLSVQYATSNGTAWTNSLYGAVPDFRGVSGTLTFRPGGPATQYINIPILGDRIYESRAWLTNEHFYVNLRSTNAVLQDERVEITVLTDDAIPSMSLNDVSLLEGDTGTNLFVFDVTLSHPIAYDVDLYWSVLPGTARFPQDFFQISSRGVITAGRTTARLIIGVPGDKGLEVDETFQVTAIIPNVGLAAATGTILNDDTLPEVYISHYGTSESWPEASVTFELSTPFTNTVLLDYATADGAALAGIDYLPAAGRLTFPPGVISNEVAIRLLDDEAFEPPEVLHLNVSGMANVTLVSTQVAIFIYDNDRLMLPGGFAANVLTSNLTLATRMEFAPDGRLFVCEQRGVVRILKDGVLLPDPFLRLEVTTEDYAEAGLLGIAVDPGFVSNQFVYVYYTVPSSGSTNYTVHNRVSRFTAEGNVARSGSETVILELDPLARAQVHNGGAIGFGGDGKLYVGVGENGFPANAQVLTNRLGKMLRINSDGSIPGDNPFSGSAKGPNRAIWALGLRNPFAFAVQPGSGRMFINDVGLDTWEEINEGRRGANYGWPQAEGRSSISTYRNPFYAYAHGAENTNGCSITGGAFYAPQHPTFPPDFEGAYFFADYCGGWIRRLDSTSATATDFIAGLDSPVDLKVGPDGALYCLTYHFWNSVVWRFHYAPSSGIRLIQSSAGWVQLRNGVVPGWLYVLEQSTNLITWIPVQTNRASGTVLDLSVPHAPGNRFYRLAGSQ